MSRENQCENCFLDLPSFLVLEQVILKGFTAQGSPIFAYNYRSSLNSRLIAMWIIKWFLEFSTFSATNKPSLEIWFADFDRPTRQIYVSASSYLFYVAFRCINVRMRKCEDHHQQWYKSIVLRDAQMHLACAHCTCTRSPAVRSSVNPSYGGSSIKRQVVSASSDGLAFIYKRSSSLTALKCRQVKAILFLAAFNYLRDCKLLFMGRSSMFCLSWI